MLAALLAVSSLAATPDLPRPSSVLVFPIHDSTDGHLTLLSVTNTSTDTATQVFFHYVNVTPGAHELMPYGCSVFCRTEYLTPADTITVSTACHNEGVRNRGYVVVSARNPLTGAPWSHDHLVGSEMLIGFGSGSTPTLLPAPFRAMTPPGAPTDLDRDARMDFDGREYEHLPDDLVLDSFLAVVDPRLVLFSLSGRRDDRVATELAIWNDNEFPLSLHLEFKCWFALELTSLSTLFSEAFLRASTPHDRAEVDLNCDRRDDLEAGFVRISASHALLGGVVPGRRVRLGGARLLWGKGNEAGEFGEF